MKITKILFLVCCTLVSCKNDDDTINISIISDWHLIEVLADPGDGSGQFMPIDSDKTISFFDAQANYAVQSNYSLCTIGEGTTGSSTGTYNPSTEEIVVIGCFGTNSTLLYEIVNNQLIVSYPCIEACQEKYESSL